MEFVGGIRQQSCDQMSVNAGGSDRQVVNKVFQEILEFWVSRQRTVDGLIFDISPSCVTLFTKPTVGYTIYASIRVAGSCTGRKPVCLARFVDQIGFF